MATITLTTEPPHISQKVGGPLPCQVNAQGTPLAFGEIFYDKKTDSFLMKKTVGSSIVTWWKITHP